MGEVFGCVSRRGICLWGPLWAGAGVHPEGSSPFLSCSAPRCDIVWPCRHALKPPAPSLPPPLRYYHKMYELALVQPGPHRVWKLVCAMEAKMSMMILRAGLAHDILAAQGMVGPGRGRGGGGEGGKGGRPYWPPRA